MRQPSRSWPTTAASFPDGRRALRRLPGIGRYTAGAIASIAFGGAEPILEANSRRVFARLVGHAEPVGGAGDEPLWQVAGGSRAGAAAGPLQSGVMDLGAISLHGQPAAVRSLPAGGVSASRG